MKNLLFLFIILGSFLSLQAQVSKTVTLSTAGTLSSILSVDELNTVTSLTLTGNIDARDFKTMRDLMPVLAEVHLSGAGIVAYSGTEGTSITGNTNYPANSIPETAFMNASYKGKNSLMSITLPNSLISIELQSFRGCSGITNVIIPSSTLYIRTYAFAACFNLKAVNIPASVSSIGTYAFGDSPVAFSVDINNNSYCSENGILFNKEKTYLFQSPPSISGNYVIPSTVETIGGYAFSRAEELNSILIPTSVKYIKEGAFTSCLGLTSIQFPISVITIENWAFQSCSGLKSVTAPWMVPLKLGTTVFANIDKSNCILKVPFGTTSVYQASDQWKDFQNIGEMVEAQKTYVPDDNFEQALINLGYDSGQLDDYVPTANISGVRSLNIYNKNISDLTGIQDFSSLAELICSLNKITNLELRNNQNLVRLFCDRNQLITLDLSKVPKLTYLSCYSNQISILNISNNIALNYLNCNDNKLTDLNVSNNLQLEQLNCFTNQISSLDVSNNVQLKNIDCDVNQINFLDVSNNTALVELHCRNNQISSLNLRSNTALTMLDLSSNKIVTIDLSSNPKLYQLYSYNNLITNLDVSQNFDLVYLYSNNNRISTIDLSKNLGLQRLNLASNQLASIDLSKNISLISVVCANNQLRSLNLRNGNNLNMIGTNKFVDATGNPNLFCIQVDNPSLADTYTSWKKDAIASYSSDCSPKTYVPDDYFEQALVNLGYDSGPLDDYVPTANISSVTSLDVSGKGIVDLKGIEGFFSLEELNIFSNNLNEIDLSDNVKLKRLLCSNNKLSNLNIKNNKLLTELWCSNNQLSSLDVSSNVALEVWLACDGNKLADLDLSQNTKLLRLRCGNNLLSSLDLSKNLLLGSLDCRYNKLSSIDLSLNAKLRLLNCNGNLLTSLNLASNNLLTGLYCSYNQLTTLNIKNGNNYNMTGKGWDGGEIGMWQALYADNNPNLSCIQVDDPTLALTYTDWTIDAHAGYSGNCVLPVANAGTDQKVNAGASVVLNGSLSFDSYGDPLTYTWTAQTGIILNADDPIKPSFIAPEVSREKNYTFTLMVNDGTENSLVDAVIVTVKPINAAPNVIVNNLTVKLDATGNYMLSLTDLKSLAAGTTDDKDSFKNLKIVAEPNAFSCGNLGNPVSVKVTVSDSEGASSTGNAFVTVLDVTPPTFSSVPRSYNVAILTGETYALPDFSELYSAKDGCSNVTYIQTPATGTTYKNSAKETIILKASDGYNNVAQVNISFILTVRSKLKSAELNASNDIIESPRLDVYPNPFKERVNLVLTSPTDADVVLEIFNNSGIKLKTLFSGTIKGNQMNTFEYIPGDIPSQLIFYRLLIGDKLKTGKLILDK